MKTQTVLVILFNFALSAVLFASLFKNGVYYSHDGEVHIARLAQFRQALEDGQLPARWLGNWNFGYGYPALVYVYSLPYYLGTIMTLLSLNYEQIFKILIFSSAFFSGLTFYYFSRNYFSKTASIVGSLFYVSAPYRISDIYERGAVAESLSFIFLPLLFLAVKFLKKSQLTGFIATSVVVFATLTTHTLTFAVFLPFLAIFWILEVRKDFKLYFSLISAIIFGFLLSSFQILPMIFEQKYINLGQTYFNLYQGHLLQIHQLLRIPLAATTPQTGIQLGLAQTIILTVALILALKKLILKQKQSLLLIFFTASSLIAAFLSLESSKFIWDNFAPLHIIILPWRYLTFTTFASAFLAASLISAIKIKGILPFALLASLVLAVIPSRHFIKWQGFFSYPNDVYLNYPDSHKLDNYFLPENAKNFDEIILPPVSVVSGKGEVELISKASNHIEVSTNLDKQSLVQLHTMHFPGWQLFVDGQKSQIKRDVPNLNGIIVASVPQGRHLLDLRFTETLLRRFANLLSFGSFIFLGFILMRVAKSSSLVKKYYGA